LKGLGQTLYSHPNILHLTDKETILNMSPASFILSSSADQTALDFMEGRQNLAIAVASFLTDCKVRNLSPRTIKFYRDYLLFLLTFADAQSVSTIQDVDAAFLRCYILMFSEQHNPGGVHAAFRSIRAFLFWVEKEELMPVDWKNPIKKVDAPHVPDQIIEPVPLKDVNSLLATCKGNSFF
jgi:site-specific recombinase XerD